MLDALHVSLALGPLAVYLMVLGMLNLSRRTVLTTGGRDLFALGLALSGFVVIGPLDLFSPFLMVRASLARLTNEAVAAAWFGPLVWGVMIALYLLALTLVSLLSRPRLVIYNIAPEELRVLMQRMIDRLGLQHTWAGESLILPTWGIQLHTTTFLATRNVSVCSTGARQNRQGWRQLRRELGFELSQVEVRPNPVGMTMLMFSLLILAGVILRLMQSPASTAYSLFDMLRQPDRQAAASEK